MVRLTRGQRALAADKILDVANLVLAAIVIGYAVGEPTLSGRARVAAFGIWVAAFAFAMIVEPSDD